MGTVPPTPTVVNQMSIQSNTNNDLMVYATYRPVKHCSSHVSIPTLPTLKFPSGYDEIVKWTTAITGKVMQTLPDLHLALERMAYAEILPPPTPPPASQIPDHMKGVVKKAFELYQAALPIMESQRLVMFGAILDCLDEHGKDELITSPLYARLKANGDPIGLIRLIQNIFPNNGVNT